MRDAERAAPAASYLYLACAFLTKLMSTAFAYGIGLSTAMGTHTFMPRRSPSRRSAKSQSKIVR